MPGLVEPSEIAENKVFILFFIRKVNMSIGEIQLIKFMLENRFMNYFYLQQYISELLAEELIAAKRQDQNLFYGITPKGLSVLEMFESILPAGLKKRLEQSIVSIRKSIRMESLITADYTPEEDNGYTISCKIKEDDFSLIELKVAAGSREDARNICRNWTNSPQEVYSEILETLLKERKKEATQ